MSTSTAVMRRATLAFVLGLLCLPLDFLALFTGTELCLAGVLLLGTTSLVLGFLTMRQVPRIVDDSVAKGLIVPGGLFAILGLVGGLLFLPAAFAVWEAAARSETSNNLYAIGQAMYRYAADHDDRLPAAALYDKEDRPLLSWRVALLPYLGESDLYREFHLDEPWDSEHNRPLLPRMPRVYASPGVPAEPSQTFFQVFTGPGTAFEGTIGLRVPVDFPDGTSNTILIVEAGESVPWTMPTSLAYDPAKPLPPLGVLPTPSSRLRFYGLHRDKRLILGLVDGYCRGVPADLPETTIRQAIIRNDDPYWKEDRD